MESLRQARGAEETVVPDVAWKEGRYTPAGTVAVSLAVCDDEPAGDAVYAWLGTELYRMEPGDFAALAALGQAREATGAEVDAWRAAAPQTALERLTGGLERMRKVMEMAGAMDQRDIHER